MGALAVVFQQRSAMDCVDRRFIAVQRASKVGPVVPGPTLDKSVVVARYSSDGRSGYEEISNRGVARVRGPNKGGPWDQVFNEHRLQRIHPREILGESLKVASQRNIAVRI